LFFIWYLAYRHESGTRLEGMQDDQSGPFPVPYDFLSSNYLFDQSDYPLRLEPLIRGEREVESITEWCCSKYLPVQWGGAKRWVRRAVAWLSRRWVGLACVAMVSPYLPLADQLRITWRSRFAVMPLFIQDEENPRAPISSEMRRWRREREGFSGPLDALVYGLVLKQLPYVHLEGYRRLACQLPPRLPRLRAVFSATGWLQEESLKLLAARSAEQGVLRIGMQHGGHPYGSGDSPLVALEQALVDRFLTWGWRSREGDIPFYSIKFSSLAGRFADTEVKDRRDILYTTTSGSRFAPDGLSVPSGDQMEGYLADQRRFVEALSPSLRKDLLVRIYPGDAYYGWRQRERLEALGLGLRFDNSRPRGAWVRARDCSRKASYSSRQIVRC